MTQLPPLIMTSEIGSFAQETIQERKGLIIDKILSHYNYTPSIRIALQDLKEKLTQSPIEPLHEATSDRTIWDKDLETWLGKTWLQIPWFLAETYFYRRVLEATQYFQPGPWMGRDPYAYLKDAELLDSLPVLAESFSPSSKSSLNNFQSACYKALWGNRGDLSNLHTFTTEMGTQSERIILDHTETAYHYLKQKPAKIAYFFDNVGKELYFDLALIDHLLEMGLATSITCYVKNQPFFVSDAMEKDFNKALELMKFCGSKKVQLLAQRIIKARFSGKMELLSPPFFTTSRMYRQMPDVLKSQISSHDLTILKGDVNYRRLFGDRHWRATVSIGEAGGYFPSSFLSLRTLKAELILGISEETFLTMKNKAEPDWMINGKRGMITFFEK